MREITEVRYVCEGCQEHFATASLALACEENHACTHEETQYSFGDMSLYRVPRPVLQP
jgi:hypothetical protein